MKPSTVLQKRSGAGVGAKIATAINGQLQLGHYSDVDGYAGFCAMQSQIDEWSQKIL